MENSGHEASRRPRRINQLQHPQRAAFQPMPLAMVQWAARFKPHMDEFISRNSMYPGALGLQQLAALIIGYPNNVALALASDGSMLDAATRAAKDRTRRYHEDANTRCKKAAISFYSGQRMPLAAGSTESDMQVVPEIAEVYLGDNLYRTGEQEPVDPVGSARYRTYVFYAHTGVMPNQAEALHIGHIQPVFLAYYDLVLTELLNGRFRMNDNTSQYGRTFVRRYKAHLADVAMWRSPFLHGVGF